MSTAAIKTARRVFEVLEYFDEVKRPLTLREVSAHFGYPVSSTAALLKSLLQLGYVDFNRPTRTYMPTMRVAMLGDWIQASLFGEGRILRLMQYLNEMTGEMVSLGTQSDIYMQYVHVLYSREGLQYRVRPGTVRSMTRSGYGWLLLSAMPDAEIDKVLRRVNIEEDDPARRMTLDELMVPVTEVRQLGYVYSRHTVTQGAGVIGMLLPPQSYGRRFTVGVGGPVDRLEEKHDMILALLREAIPRFLPG
ncbi:helix-turn-helix domain-containing protein [Tistrella mobilis]|uniref:IclR family transcriptional regulator n=1 Tax=Tistrella mobilis TaxID=171437 RepID=UPI0035564557